MQSKRNVAYVLGLRFKAKALHVRKSEVQWKREPDLRNTLIAYQ